MIYCRSSEINGTKTFLIQLWERGLLNNVFQTRQFLLKRIFKAHCHLNLILGVLCFGGTIHKDACNLANLLYFLVNLVNVFSQTGL